jgi:hypothetical protein
LGDSEVGVRKVFDKKNKLLNNMAEIIISAVLIGLFGICLFGIIDIQRQIRKNDKK